MSWGVSDVISSYHMPTVFRAMMWGKLYEMFTIPCSRSDDHKTIIKSRSAVLWEALADGNYTVLAVPL